LKSNGGVVSVAFRLDEGVTLGAEVIFADGSIDPVPPVSKSTVVPPVVVKLAAPEVTVPDGMMVAFDDDAIVLEGVVTPVGIIASDPPVEVATAVPPDCETFKAPDVGKMDASDVTLTAEVTATEGVVALMDGEAAPVPPEEYVVAAPPEGKAINDPFVGVEILTVGTGVGMAMLNPDIRSVEFEASLLATMLPEVGAADLVPLAEFGKRALESVPPVE
jgi:hypothetical protein